MANTYYFNKKSFISDLIYKWRRKDNYKKYKKYNKVKALSEFEIDAINEIESNGFVILNNFIASDIVDDICSNHEKNLNDFRFNFPVFSNSMNLKKYNQDGKLIQVSDLEGTDAEINYHEGLTYYEFIKKHHPGILKVTLDKYGNSTINTWLNESILRIVSGYMGCIPQMEEAYIRRSFPISIPIQNNHWHRDTNDYRKTIKVFFILSDVTQEQGPLHYLKGTHQNFDYCNGKKYYSDKEVESSFNNYSKLLGPLNFLRGTVVIADTRGLHKAGSVVTGYRDQGFAVFLNNTKYNPGNFSVSENNYNNLSNFQKLFLNRNNISKKQMGESFLKSI